MPVPHSTLPAHRASPAAGAGPARGQHSRADWALAAVVVLGLVIRVCAMYERPLLGDEARIADAVETGYGQLLRIFGGAFTQPAFLLTAKASTELLGGTLGVPMSLRLPALLMSLLSIVVIGRLARDIAGAEVGFWAAFLLAINPFHVFYSQMATAYSMVIALSLLSTHSLITLARVLRGEAVSSRGSPIRLGVAYVLWTALAIHAHLGSLGIVMGQAASLLLLCRMSGRARAGGGRNLLILGGLVGGAGVLGIALYYPAWAPMMEFRDRFTLGGFTFDFVPLFLTAVSGGRGLSVYALIAAAALGLALALRSPVRREFLAVVVCVPLGVLAFYWLNDSSHKAWAHARFFLPVLPALLIACANGLAQVSGALSSKSASGRRGRRPIGWMACALLGIIVWGQAALVVRIAWGPGDLRYRELAEYVQAELPPNAVVIYMPMRHGPLEGLTQTNADDSFEIMRCRALEYRLSAELLDRPFLFAVDLVPFGAADWGRDWVVHDTGTTTLVHRRRPGRVNRDVVLRDVLRMVNYVLEFLERPTLDQEREWVFWRIDKGHQHMFLPEVAIEEYRKFQELLHTQLGLGAERPAWQPRPEPNYWRMLEPHVDFW